MRQAHAAVIANRPYSVKESCACEYNPYRKANERHTEAGKNFMAEFYC